MPSARFQIAFSRHTVAAQLHLAGAVTALIGLVILMIRVATHGNDADLIACLVYAVSSVLVFAVSSTLHFLVDGFRVPIELETKLENLDHYAIFLFIAGTYTPVVVNTVASPVLLILIWAIAVLGISYTYLKPRLPLWAQHRALSTALFVAMGWVLVSRVGEVLHNMTVTQAVLMFAGALSYTLGAVIYAIKRPNPFGPFFGYHEIWHLTVVFGFLFHYFMILAFY